MTIDISGLNAEDFDKKSTELKDELQKLILPIISGDKEVDTRGDNAEGIVGKIDKAIAALAALKELELKRPKHVDDFIVPVELRCPLSTALIRDPVTPSTNQTYDRPYIEKWLKDVSRTAPETQKVLSDVELTPNDLLHKLITDWCEEHGFQLPPPVQEINVVSLRDADRKHISFLLQKLSSNLSDQMEAAKQICELTKEMPSSRSFFGESADVMTQLLLPLADPKTFVDHPDLQEDLITAVLNISLLDDNKEVIAKCPCVVPLLIKSLKRGSMKTRTNAAAALSSLSALDDNKLLIGKEGALKPLFDLLEQGHRSALKDVASAIYNLCRQRENRGLAVTAGAVKVLAGKVKERVYVSEMLAILALLTANRTAIDELEKLDVVGCLLSIIRESDSETDRENCTVILCDFSNLSIPARNALWEDEKVNGTISKMAETGTSMAKRKAKAILDRRKPNENFVFTRHWLAKKEGY